MTVTEQQAQSRAASDLHILLVAAAVTDEVTVKTWDAEKLWEELLDFLWDMKLENDMDGSPFIALLKAGAINRLARLIIDFAPLSTGSVQIWQSPHQVSVRTYPVVMRQDFIRPVILQLMTETWWPALRCFSQISHTLFKGCPRV